MNASWEITRALSPEKSFLSRISPVEPYSADYNTVLMEAQEDQHNQARPELISKT